MSNQENKKIYRPIFDLNSLLKQGYKCIKYTQNSCVTTIRHIQQTWYEWLGNLVKVPATGHNANVKDKVRHFPNESIMWGNGWEVTLGCVSIFYSWGGIRLNMWRTNEYKHRHRSSHSSLRGLYPWIRLQTCINISSGIMHWNPAGTRFLASVSYQCVEDWNHPLSHSREAVPALRCFNQSSLKTSSNERMRLMRICWKIK